MNNYIKFLRKIFYANLIFPITIILIFVILFLTGTKINIEGIKLVFFIMIPFFAVLFISLGFLMFKKQITLVKKETNIDAKLFKYRFITLIRFASIEGVAFLSIFAFIETMNYFFVIFTILILSIFIPIYPSFKRVSNDLDLESELLTNGTLDAQITNKKFNKKSLLAIPIIIIVLLLNYNSFRDIFTNKVELPTIQVDNGTIQDSIYHNIYLDWTFIIPNEYKVIPENKIQQYEDTGNEYFDNKTSNSSEPMRLLNISNGKVDFMSNLNPRVLFPNISTEDKYISMINEKYLSSNTEDLKIEKLNQGTIKIDSLNFKYVEYLATGTNGQFGMLFMTKFNADYMLDFSLSYTDMQEALNFINRLKCSELNWK